MGFFSDPAASSAPIESPKTPTSSRRSSSRRRRSSVNRGSRRRDSDTIPNMPHTSPGRSNNDGIIPSSRRKSVTRTSSIGKGLPRRRSSASSTTATRRRSSGNILASLSASMSSSFNGHGSNSSSNDLNNSMKDMSLQDHLTEMESFVNHIASVSNKKERRKLLARASAPNL